MINSAAVYIKHCFNSLATTIGISSTDKKTHATFLKFLLTGSIDPEIEKVFERRYSPDIDQFITIEFTRDDFTLKDLKQLRSNATNEQLKHVSVDGSTLQEYTLQGHVKFTCLDTKIYRSVGNNYRTLCGKVRLLGSVAGIVSLVSASFIRMKPQWLPSALTKGSIPARVVAATCSFALAALMTYRANGIPENVQSFNTEAFSNHIKRNAVSLRTTKYSRPLLVVRHENNVLAPTERELFKLEGILNDQATFSDVYQHSAAWKTQEGKAIHEHLTKILSFEKTREIREALIKAIEPLRFPNIDTICLHLAVPLPETQIKGGLGLDQNLQKQLFEEIRTYIKQRIDRDDKAALPEDIEHYQKHIIDKEVARIFEILKKNEADVSYIADEDNFWKLAQVNKSDWVSKLKQES